jgi:predicted lipid-binding transport protein (Tim44 family)
MFGGLMGGLAGFALGGLLGSMLFGGMGMGSGFGFGLLEMLLVGAGVFMLFKFMRRRQAQSPQPAYATAGGPSSGYASYAEPARGGGAAATLEAPAAPSDLDRGLGHIRQMDARFDPEMFATVARNAFLEIQQGVAQRDVSWLRDRVAPELYATLQAQCDRLRAARQTNHVEQIRIQRAQVTEAWQESGRDFVTAHLTASLLDYTVDDATGGVVEGSKTTPQTVEEFWTFVRPVGNNPWQLTAIQTV